ncbi:MAG: metallophosphoesterase [Chitinophagaceae bacterium]|nr:metallophosphoesterase [Chitinophagaceae bacterium]
MRKLLQKILRGPITRLANKVSSSPHQKAVFTSLNQLLQNIREEKTGCPPPVSFDMNTGKFIILSDQHKGGKDLADDFRNTENNYMTALQHYFDEGFTFINLGDCEELWENTPAVAVDKNRLTLLEEAQFLTSERYYRIYGNHDLEWKYLFPETVYLKPIFGSKLAVYEGLILTTTYNNKNYSFFLAHGHQGDQRSDGNTFSMWFVAAIWTPIQRYLEISVDTISDFFELVDKHNIMMYEWSATQKDMIFISGHTHKPVFASLDHIDRLTKQLEKAKASKDAALIVALQQQLEKRKAEYAGKKLVKTMAKPSYFNSGCCCFSDGDLTGIEIENGFIRLVKWKVDGKSGKRMVLEESPLFYVFDQL